VASESPASGERIRIRILIVPDGLLGAELGESFLDRQSLSVRTAKDTTQGLSMAELWRPHLIVFRSNPREDAERFGVLKSIAGEPAPKLIMVTDRLQGTEAPADAACDAHLVSPLDVDQLLSTIAELIDLPRRRCERVPIDVLVHTEGFASGTEPDATLSSALAVSEEGMLLEASRQLSLGERGQVQFFLPGSAERLTLEGCVRVAVDEIRLIYVLEFVDLAPQHRAQIRRYVDSQREAA
jgi:DNA-binding response OmpR family regulator